MGILLRTLLYSARRKKESSGVSGPLILGAWKAVSRLRGRKRRQNSPCSGESVARFLTRLPPKPLRLVVNNMCLRFPLPPSQRS